MRCTSGTCSPFLGWNLHWGLAVVTAERWGLGQAPGEEQLPWTKDTGISSDLERRLRVALYWHAQHVTTIPQSPTSCLLGGFFFLFLPISVVDMNHSCWQGKYAVALQQQEGKINHSAPQPFCYYWLTSNYAKVKTTQSCMRKWQGICSELELSATRDR